MTLRDQSRPKSRHGALLSHLWAPIIGGCLALTVYVLTMAPSLTWAHWGADGGDFITAAVTGRIPHPPGFPLYTALARLMLWLGWGDPAWWLNFFSALMASAAVGILVLALQQRSVSTPVALSSALTMAFAPLFWSQALITEVYTMATCLVALALLVGLRSGSRQSMVTEGRPRHSEGRDIRSRLRLLRYRLLYTPWCWFMIGLTWGLAVSVHPTLIYLAPLWLALLWGSRVRKAKGICFSLLLIGFLVGIVPYALLPLSGPWPQPWGDMRNARGWLDVVTARLYWGYAFDIPLNYLPRRLLALGHLFVRQFTPVGFILVLCGLFVLWQRERPLLIGLFISVILGSFYAVGYNTPDSLVYLVSWLPLGIVLMAEGLQWVTSRWLPSWVGSIIVLVLLVWNWGSLNLHHDDEAIRWLEQALVDTPSQAVLVSEEDHYTFALWYAQQALGIREDILVVDRDLLAQAPYREFLLGQTGYAAVTPEDFADDRAFCEIDEGEVLCR